MSIAIIAVGLRLVAKRIRNRIDYSDYCIIIACLWNTAMQGCCISMVTYGGFGFHTREVFTRFGPATARYFFKGIMTFSILWNVVVGFSKVSVLLMYTTLIPTIKMIRWAKMLGALIVLWCLSDIAAALLICRPLARNWDFTLPGTCGSQPDFYFAMGVVNLITDAVLIALPMPYLYKLAMPKRKKFLAMGLLSIGLGTWAITIYRQTLLPHLDFTDMTYAGVHATILSGLEPSVAIVLACIPLMRPLFGKSRNSADTGYEYGSSGKASYFSKKSAGPHNMDPTATFSELVDNSDDSSQIELRPVEGIQRVCISSDEERPRKKNKTLSAHTISVERKWEVRTG